MHLLLLLIAAVGLCYAAPQLLAGDSSVNLGPRQGVNRVFISRNCTDAERNQIVAAWAEAEELADALNAWKPTTDYQDVMDMYMGTRSTSPNYRDILLANIAREKAAFEPTAWLNNRIYFQCNKNIFLGPRYQCKESTVGFADTLAGTIWTDQFITFCGPFFSFTSLAQKMEDGRSEKSDPHNIELFRDQNRGFLMFHEMTHMRFTVGNPYIIDGPTVYVRIYSSKAVFELARDSNIEASYITAESYSFTALAIYMQQKLDLCYIPRPPEYPEEGALLNRRLPNPNLSVRRHNPPERRAKYNGPANPNDPNSMPDPNEWDQLWGPPPSAPTWTPDPNYSKDITPGTSSGISPSTSTAISDIERV